MRVKTRIEMPVLLAIGMGISLLAAGMFCFLLVGSVLGFTTYTDESGAQVPAAEFFASGGIFVYVSFIVLSVIGIALWKEQAWSRPVMLLYWALFAAWDLGQLFRAERRMTLIWFIALPCAAWYLYGKRTVVEYYAALRAKAAPPPLPSTAA